MANKVTITTPGPSGPSGLTWKNQWAASTSYAFRDVVRYTVNGNLYFCTVAHTSGTIVPTNISYWNLFVDNTDSFGWATTAKHTQFTDSTGTSEYSSKHYALKSKDWASLTTNAVTNNADSSDEGYSAKAWAIGGTGVTDTANKGAAKEWAIEESGTVDGTSYSAKEYAQGTQASTGGSAKNWASQTGSQVTGSSSATDASAKEWAIGTSAHKSDGSAKGYTNTAKYTAVPNASGTVYSSLHHMGQALDWASKTDGAVRNDANDADVDYSSKAYAVGGTGVDTGAGSAKDWATKTSGNVGSTSTRGAKYYAESASTDAGTATGAASTATTNATKSGRHEDNAEAYAQTNAETLVTYTDPTTGSTSNDGYSAKHYREKSQEWASSSSNITDDTGTAISPAIKSAKTYAEDAQTSFTNISNAEANCSTSEANAASSATASEDSKLTSTSYATATGAEVQHYSSGVGTSQTGVYSAKEHATGTTVTTGSAKDWATKAGSAQVASTDYSAKAWAQNTANDIGSAKDWATKAGNATVASTDYSSKAYAHDTANDIGSSRDWASKLSAQVASTDYSAKEYAIGTTATSAKSYAIKDDGVVTGTDYSAKAWAVSTDSNAPTDGSAKEWATNVGSAEVATGEGYSSKAYAQDDSNDIGSSKDWAVKTSGQVASSDYSSKEWATGTQTRGASSGGSSKDWATYTGGTVDNADYSAKYYKNATQTLHDSFFGVYHGSLSSAPSTHQAGDLYFNTSTNSLYVSTGSAWNPIVTFDQDLNTTDSPSFTNLTVSGNLEVQGTTTTVDAQTTVSETLTLNNNQSSQTDIALDVNSTSTGDAINVSQNSTGKAVVINQVDTSTGGNIIELQSNGTAKVSVDKAGDTTFVGAVTVPTPTASGHATTKTYVDAVDTLIDNHIADTSNPHSVTASDVGLGNVTNESKATMFTDPTFTGTVSGVTATHVGLGSASNHASVADTGGTFTGNVKIGSAGAPTQTLDVDGAILASGNITAFSDKRHKENIETIDNALEKVGNMRGVYFTFSKDHFTGVDPTKRQVGVIAQEMQQVLPEGVEYNKDKDTYGVNYGNLVGVLIEAVKELKDKVNELENK